MKDKYTFSQNKRLQNKKSITIVHMNSTAPVPMSLFFAYNAQIYLSFNASSILFGYSTSKQQCRHILQSLHWDAVVKITEESTLNWNSICLNIHFLPNNLDN